MSLLILGRLEPSGSAVPMFSLVSINGFVVCDLGLWYDCGVAVTGGTLYIGLKTTLSFVIGVMEGVPRRDGVELTMRRGAAGSGSRKGLRSSSASGE